MTIEDATESLWRFATHGVPCGGFLTAVLENDLMEAMNRADESSRANLFNICSFVYNDLPAGCHGSREAVAKWAERIRAGAS
jgi:hypothetical protein